MNMRAIKRILMIALPLLFAAVLLVYIKEYNPFHKEGQNSFTETADGIIVDASGEEYAFLCHEGNHYLKDLPPDGLIFEGYIADEPDTLNHLGFASPTGMYSIRGDRSFDILIRFRHGSEFYTIYRKSSLETLEAFSILENHPMPFSIYLPVSLRLILD